MARYAKGGELHIAYIVEGDGPIDLVWVPPWVSQVEYLWAERSMAAFMERLTSFARLITFDRRGSGLSDPFFGAPTLEEQMDDVLAVMDAAGSERAAFVGTLEGGPMAALFAATYPERTAALILYATYARATWAPDYDWAWPAEERKARMDEHVEHWGEGRVAGGVARSQLHDPEFVEWAARLERLAASPGTIKRIFDLIGKVDVRDVLPSIRVPTLVMHRRDDDFIKLEHSRYLASHIQDARFVELEGSDNVFAVGDSEAVLGEIEEFLTGDRHERERIGCWPPCCSRTSSTPPAGRRRWATRAGGRCSSATTCSSGGRSSGTGAARSSTPATASWRRSTVRPAPSAAPPR